MFYNEVKDSGDLPIRRSNWDSAAMLLGRKSRILFGPFMYDARTVDVLMGYNSFANMLYTCLNNDCVALCLSTTEMVFRFSTFR